jgi:hypothetical protein
MWSLPPLAHRTRASLAEPVGLGPRIALGLPAVRRALRSL